MITLVDLFHMDIRFRGGLLNSFGKGYFFEKNENKNNSCHENIRSNLGNFF